MITETKEKRKAVASYYLELHLAKMRALLGDEFTEAEWRKDYLGFKIDENGNISVGFTNWHESFNDWETIDEVDLKLTSSEVFEKYTALRIQKEKEATEFEAAEAKEFEAKRIEREKAEFERLRKIYE